MLADHNLTNAAESPQQHNYERDSTLCYWKLFIENYGNQIWSFVDFTENLCCCVASLNKSLDTIFTKEQINLFTWVHEVNHYFVTADNNYGKLIIMRFMSTILINNLLELVVPRIWYCKKWKSTLHQHNAISVRLKL